MNLGRPHSVSIIPFHGDPDGLRRMRIERPGAILWRWDAPQAPASNFDVVPPARQRLLRGGARKRSVVPDQL